jgi:hypothetical protein
VLVLRLAAHAIQDYCCRIRLHVSRNANQDTSRTVIQSATNAPAHARHALEAKINNALLALQTLYFQALPVLRAAQMDNTHRLITSAPNVHPLVPNAHQMLLAQLVLKETTSMVPIVLLLALLERSAMTRPRHATNVLDMHSTSTAVSLHAPTATMLILISKLALPARPHARLVLVQQHAQPASRAST